ncbi:hypothetical protein J2W17_005561 [Pseudomonas lini]|uniref:hypothetical protein n=1 Tax=Pseudomonas lini TaxID=163011 RepID=UPI0027863DE1|nr:hypothetical protein [Pseudomonas lini]MDQ0126575.1 hypothetical protein [Pseudomonas lini]
MCKNFVKVEFLRAYAKSENYRLLKNLDFWLQSPETLDRHVWKIYDRREQHMRILLAGEKSIPHSIATLDKVHGVALVGDIGMGKHTHEQ